MAVLVTIPISTFEITINYDSPNLRLSVDQTDVTEALFEAFRPWGQNVDDIDVIDQGKNSDKGVRFRLPPRKASFFFGPSYCRFAQDDATWGMAEEMLEILDAGLSTLFRVAKLRVGAQHTALALHLQLKTGKFVDVLTPFVPDQLSALEARPVQTMASVVKWENRKIYIDGSGVLANALFVKLERDFGPETSYRDAAEQIRADEDIIFNILGVKEDPS